jgi:hypothetical protein
VTNARHSPAEVVTLAAGATRIEAPRSLVELSQPRTLPAAFFSESGAAALEVRRVEGPLSSPLALASPHAPWGDVELTEDVLSAHIPDNVYAAEAVLRAAWQIVCHRSGGVLMHGCAFHWDGRGVVAIGASGDGKSTLSRLSRSAPGNATLLTDEIVWLTPSAECWGTPFRSDEDNAGSPGPAKITALLVLAKGQHEALQRLTAGEALPLLLAQLYMPIVPVVPRGELVRRLMAVVDTVGVHRLTFRKHPDVGPFLRRVVGA